MTEEQRGKEKMTKEIEDAEGNRGKYSFYIKTLTPKDFQKLIEDMHGANVPWAVECIDGKVRLFVEQ